MTTGTTGTTAKLPPVSIGLRVWETGLEAEHILSQQVPLVFKALFLLTNLPYWILCVVATREAIRTSFLAGGYVDAEGEVCGRPEIYAVLLFVVAASSTIMHGSQLRMGELMCCAHEERVECFHKRENLKTFKKVDISCALLASAACLVCHAWEDLYYTVVVAGPLFLSGLVLKRLGHNYLYMTVHGLWHIVTAMLVWDAVMGWVA